LTSSSDGKNDADDASTPDRLIVTPPANGLRRRRVRLDRRAGAPQRVFARRGPRPGAALRPIKWTSIAPTPDQLGAEIED